MKIVDCVCTVCGAQPITSFCYDLIDTEQGMAEDPRRYVPSKKLRYGCEAHPAETETVSKWNDPPNAWPTPEHPMIAFQRTLRD